MTDKQLLLSCKKNKICVKINIKDDILYQKEKYMSFSIQFIGATETVKNPSPIELIYLFFD